MTSPMVVMTPSPRMKCLSTQIPKILKALSVTPVMTPVLIPSGNLVMHTPSEHPTPVMEPISLRKTSRHRVPHLLRTLRQTKLPLIVVDLPHTDLRIALNHVESFAEGTTFDSPTSPLTGAGKRASRQLETCRPEPHSDFRGRGRTRSDIRTLSGPRSELGSSAYPSTETEEDIELV